MVIYKIINLINGKFYIGKSVKNKNGYFGSGKLIIAAIKKYGKENFIKVILEECSDIKHLSTREKYWIEKEDAIRNGYNISTGGEGGNNITYHPNKKEIIEKVWAERRSNPNFKERCKEISIKSAETRKTRHYVSKLKGIKLEQEVKNKISNTLTKDIKDYPELVISKIIELYNNNLSLHDIQVEIRKTHPCGCILIKKVIQHFNLERKRKAAHNKKDVNSEDIKNAKESGMSKKQLCEHFHISTTTLRRYLKKE